jgi:hypothetical protein
MNPESTTRTSPASPERRRALRMLSLASLMATVGVAACGGGGGDAGAPLTPPSPSPQPAPGVSGPAWSGFGRDAQHSAVSAIATQDLNRIAWSSTLDLSPQLTTNGSLLVHYGSPVITTSNTVVMPVKTGATGGFRIEARSGVNGGLIWTTSSDYVLPAHNWMPGFNMALAGGTRVYAPGSGGKLLVRDSADSASGALSTLVFYGGTAYNANPAAYDSTVFINTPITADSAGNVYFGFVVTGSNPSGLVSGIATIDASGVGRWVAVSDLVIDAQVVKPAMNCAPALSIDRATVYIAVNTAAVSGSVQRGYLLALDSTTLALKARVQLLDPSSGTPADVIDDSTASPTIGPDGDLFYGVLEATFGTHNDRGWLLHFSADLSTTLVPGGFGWDDTPSVVPATMVPSYLGTSTYLLMSKYNNYAGIGTGDGLNRVAILDPKASQTDSISGRPIMKEVLTILGPTPESAGSSAVKEWCINTAAVDPFTNSVLVNSEDGFLYRWSLISNSFTQKIQLSGGLGESYTPTAIGADGAVYAVNDSVLFSIAK